MMKLAAVLVLLAMPCLAVDEAAERADNHRLFDLLKSRGLAASGIPASAGGLVPATDPSLPENNPAVIKRRFAEGELERTAAFDKQFGKGAFASIIKLSKNCKSTSGCDLFAVGGLIEGAHLFAALDKEAATGLPPQSPEYPERRLKILAGMKPYLERLQPSKEMSAGDAAKRLKILEPIAIGIAGAPR